jgi:hypothetical protein
MMPILNLARVISARHMNGAEGDAKTLFEKWNIDGLTLLLKKSQNGWKKIIEIGLRVVQAALQLNPSVGKQERMQNVEAAKKLFDAGSYSHQFMDDFIGLDSPNAFGVILHKGSATGGQGVSSGDASNSKSVTGFFARKKK